MVTPYYQHEGITIYHGDCREILPTLEPVDLVLTDPPYGLGDKWKGGGFNGRNGQSSVWPNSIPSWDVLAPEAVGLSRQLAEKAIIWGGNYYELPPSRCWLIWDKVQVFSSADAELAWSNLDSAVRVFRMSRIDAHMNQERGKSHPTQKPVALMKWCLGFSTDAQTILDPFMGSGTTLRAAKDLGRKAIGIEIEERYCEIAAKRMSQEVLNFS